MQTAARFVGRVKFLEDRFHAGAALDRGVRDEPQGRCESQAGACGDGVSQKRRGVIQGGDGRVPIGLGSQSRHVDTGLPEIGRQVHAGERDESDQRIAHFADRLGQHAANLFGDTLVAAMRHEPASSHPPGPPSAPSR